MQVGVGMVCRGEVALIVANRGLSLGVLSAAMMTPVIITVVGGTILTPIMLKLAFRKEGKSAIQETGLVDHYDKMEQLDICLLYTSGNEHHSLANPAGFQLFWRVWPAGVWI